MSTIATQVDCFILDVPIVFTSMSGYAKYFRVLSNLFYLVLLLLLPMLVVEYNYIFRRSHSLTKLNGSYLKQRVLSKTCGLVWINFFLSREVKFVALVLT